MVSFAGVFFASLSGFLWPERALCSHLFSWWSPGGLPACGFSCSSHGLSVSLSYLPWKSSQFSRVRFELPILCSNKSFEAFFGVPFKDGLAFLLGKPRRHSLGPVQRMAASGLSPRPPHHGPSIGHRSWGVGGRGPRILGLLGLDRAYELWTEK